ncbi:DUF6873 family GME fold protein [Fusibacter ferrireducens]|uniref:DUF6873 domain-containing protein n=1 Tax=Fusibacter ferrireducens TaxID=2785058 RepID=A0ABR9ZQU3_9FIRM|nr:hypothetical protein [Fusibacter ferrireducens]MBF4692818.1 hypothetical protein [Fusibacter ferrireducens]
MIVIIAPKILHSKIAPYFHEQTFFTEMPEIEAVLCPLRSHTDMGIHMTPKGIVIEPSIFNAMRDQLIDIGFSESQIYKGETELELKYPFDIAYNCMAIGNHFFYHVKADPGIISIYDAIGYEMNSVKQGYTKCATLVVGENAVITEDHNLYSKFKAVHIETLLISKGEILLDGFEYGFIGGTGGLYKNKLFLNGSLSHHSCKTEILNFIKAQGTEIIELHQGQLKDCGSIFIFDF